MSIKAVFGVLLLTMAVLFNSPLGAMGESPLMLVSQKISAVSSNSFTVDFESNQVVVGQIRYGTNDSFINEKKFTDSHLMTSESKTHQITIDHLTAKTSYRYQIIIRDPRTHETVQSDYQLVTTL